MAPLFTETDGVGDRLVLVHGFTQTGACWGAVSDDLATDHEVVRVDLPGHGRTDSRHDQASLGAAADLLADSGGRGTWVGYSLGGRLALHVALAHPEVVDRLVLVGATPGIVDDGERDQRRVADEALADRIEAIGVEPFIDEWLALPLFAGLTAATDCRAARLTNRAAGLADSLRHTGTGTQEPLWSRLSELSMPTLWLAGADDAKFRAIGREAAAACPRSRFAEIPGAGHTAHLEQPAAFLATLRAWLAT